MHYAGLLSVIWLYTACMHAHMANVCAICNGDVLHSRGKVKRLRLFGDSTSVADTDERAAGHIVNHELGIRLEDTTLANRKWMCYKCRNEIDRYFDSTEGTGAVY